MSIPTYFNRQLRRQQLYFAAWPAVSNTIAVGDYGLMRGGIFIKSGNIKDQYGVDFSTHDAPSSSFEFSSSGVTKVRFQAGVKVPAFEAVDVDAKLTIGFEGSRNITVSAKNMTASEMTSTAAVARALRATGEWNRRYRVVSKVYVAEGPSIFVSIENGTTVELSGKANILKQVDEGIISIDADVGVEVKSGHAWTLPNKEGAAYSKGPIGLTMFRVRRDGTDNPIRGDYEEGADIIDGSEEWRTDDDDSDLAELMPGESEG